MTQEKRGGMLEGSLEAFLNVRHSKIIEMDLETEVQIKSPRRAVAGKASERLT